MALEREQEQYDNPIVTEVPTVNELFPCGGVSPGLFGRKTRTVTVIST